MCALAAAFLRSSVKWRRKEAHLVTLCLLPFRSPLIVPIGAGRAAVGGDREQRASEVRSRNAAAMGIAHHCVIMLHEAQ